MRFNSAPHYDRAGHWHHCRAVTITVRTVLPMRYPHFNAPNSFRAMYLKRNGAPERIRTPNPQIRSLVLYPVELRARTPKPALSIVLRALLTAAGEPTEIIIPRQASCRSPTA